MYSTTLSSTLALMVWLVNATLRPLYPPVKSRYPLRSWLRGQQGLSGRVRKISPPPGFDSWTVQPVASRYTDWAIAAHKRNICTFAEDLSKHNHFASLVRCWALRCKSFQLPPSSKRQRSGKTSPWPLVHLPTFLSSVYCFIRTDCTVWKWKLKVSPKRL